MPEKRDYYDVLGVSKDAGDKEVKSAYRKLAMKYHPDRSDAPDAEERFKEISEAYAVISDPQKRRQYDQFGHSGISGQYSQEDLFRGVDFEDLLRGFGGGCGTSSTRSSAVAAEASPRAGICATTSTYRSRRRPLATRPPFRFPVQRSVQPAKARGQGPGPIQLVAETVTDQAISRAPRIRRLAR